MDVKPIVGFFQDAVGKIKPPFLRFLMVLGVVLLIAFYLRCEDALNFSILAVVLVVFATLGFAAEYFRERYQYGNRETTALKEELRKKVAGP